MGVVDIFIFVLILIAGHAGINQFIRSFKVDQYRTTLIGLFYYHLLFGLLFGWYVWVYGGDAIGYWKMTRLYQFMPNGDWWELHQPGTPFIHLVIYPFSDILGLSYWTLTLVFAFIGFFGFAFLLVTFLRTIPQVPRLFGWSIFPALLFLPNLHFWSGGIGKDSLIFFALSLFVFSLTRPIRNIPGLMTSIYLAFMIRPHIALLMIVSMIFALLTSSQGFGTFWRVVLLGLSVYVFVLISPSVLEFIGVEQNIDSFEDVSEIRSRNLSRGSVGSAIDISTYNVPLKIFTFFYRPLFVDASNLFGWIVSLENLIYLVLTLSALRGRLIADIFGMPPHLKASILMMGAAAYFMSGSLSNLGIIIRQKNMVMFMLLLLCSYLISRRQWQPMPVASKRI